MISSSFNSPSLKADIVSRDHSPIGATDAFFNDSMRRDAMIGVKIVFALEES